VARHEAPEDGCAHRIWKVGRHLPPLVTAGNLIEGCGERIGKDDLETTTTKTLLEGLHQSLIELDCSNSVKPVEEGLSEGTTSRTDLNDPRRFALEQIDDPVGDALVD